MTSSRRHKSPYDTHPEEVINRVKFDVSVPGSFRRFKTDKIALYTGCGISNVLKFSFFNRKTNINCTYYTISESH